MIYASSSDNSVLFSLYNPFCLINVTKELCLTWLYLILCNGFPNCLHGCLVEILFEFIFSCYVSTWNFITNWLKGIYSLKNVCIEEFPETKRIFIRLHPSSCLKNLRVRYQPRTNWSLEKWMSWISEIV